MAQKLRQIGSIVLALLLAFSTGCATTQTEKASIRQQNLSKDVTTLKGQTETTPSAPKQKTENKSPAPLPTITGAITVDQAIAYALSHNLQALIAAKEQEMQTELATGAAFRLLPSLIVDAERSWKSQETPRSSTSYETRETSLEPSVSEDLARRTENASLSWNMLNLTVNIFRWRQAGKRVGVAGERLKRIEQNVALDITEAFMQAVVARDMAAMAESLVERAKLRQKRIEAQIADRIISELDGLQSTIDIKQLLLRHRGYKDRYRAAMTKLIEMLGLGPDAKIELAAVDFEATPELINIEQNHFEQIALLTRPELYEGDLEEKIRVDDANIALTKMFPSLEGFSRFTHDDDSHLWRQQWVVSGLRLSWDLFSIPEYVYDRKAAIRAEETERRRRLKMTMAVLTQLRLALIEYQDANEKLPVAKGLSQDHKRLSEVVDKSVEYGKLHESLLLDEDQKYLAARHQYLTAYAEFIVAKARIANSMGLLPHEFKEKAKTPAAVAAPASPQKS